jgi:hypothetical protein
MTFTPEQFGGLGAAVVLGSGLLWKYLPKLISVLSRVEVTGKIDERRIEGQLTTEEHDKFCDLKMKNLALEIAGPINVRLAAIEAHEFEAAKWVRDLDTKVDALLARGNHASHR